jgi:hypothetical protein
VTKAKKYDYRVVPNNGSWTAEIVRRASSTKTVVSKSQAGFATEAEAQEWGQREVKSFVQKLDEQNRHRSLHHVPKPSKWDALKDKDSAD